MTGTRMETISEYVEDQQHVYSSDSKWLCFEAGDHIGHDVALEWVKEHGQDYVLWCRTCNCVVTMNNPHPGVPLVQVLSKRSEHLREPAGN